ncbi:MAG: TatD family hydrolase [Erysipelotrichaceae bacterium]|nr:TatD family hydrolase [Erysipelotrichaceae bacterium]
MLDSHCHWNDEALYPIRKDVYHRALEAGVTSFLVVGWDVPSSQKAIEIAHEFPSVYAAVGIHPENLEGCDEDDLETIRRLSFDPKVVAIGEIGLDYHWFSEEAIRQKQKEWFIRQIDLANERGLPLSIHARDAANDTYEILSHHLPKAGAVLHCYSGSPEMLERFLPLGLFFGFDGPITYRNAVTPKAAVVSCPLDRILTETDCPYLAPVPYRGEQNESCHIVEILKAMASLKGISPSEMEKRVADNFANLFHVKP